MRHHNSLFHGLTKYIPWCDFRRLVDEHGADYRVRRLKTKDQLLVMLYAQLSGASSLRDIEDGLLSQKNQLYHVGLKPTPRSTLSDANKVRPWQVFADLFGVMLEKATRRTRRKMGGVTRILDATHVALSRPNEQWGKPRNKHYAAKVHLVYDPDEALPLEVVITPETINEITPAKALKLEPGATYVFDLGYYDFGWWARMDALGCRFVSRLKSNTKLAVTKTLKVAREHGDVILSDSIGYLPQRMAGSRRNPMSDPVRELKVRIPTGKVIRIVTNDLDAPADEIADLYKQRWQIELFFRWIKQNLKIKRFLGTSKNAVAIQIYTAMIAYLILKMAQDAQTTIQSAKKFAKLVSLNLMHKRPIDTLNKAYTPPPLDPRQYIMEFSS